MIKTYTCEVDCANCANKIEAALSKLDGVESVSINFMTQKLRLQADKDNFEEVLKACIKEAKKIESDCEIY